MKILNVIGSVNTRHGGTTDHVFSCSRAWSRLGCECHILCLDPPSSDYIKNSPVKTFALGEEPTSGFQKFARRRLNISRYGYTPNLRRWFDENAKNYDAIILNGLWNYTSYGSWLALRSSSTPYYVCPHGMLDPWLRRVAPWRQMIRRAFWTLFEKNVIKDTAGIFFASEEELRIACEAYSVPREKCRVVGYGTEDIVGDPETQKAAFLARFPQLRDKRLILFLGRIHQKKGIDLLIKAFGGVAERHRDFDLVIVGPDDSALTPSLHKLATRLGVERRIHWAGMLTGNEKWGAFRCSEFFALPSHQENFGIAVVEAMAAAVPVLISDRVNIWTEVKAGRAGHIVSANVAGVTEGLDKMCSLSETEMRDMREAARRCFLENFRFEDNTREALSILVKGRAKLTST